jgi:4-coumarate--CoA ligase
MAQTIFIAGAVMRGIPVYIMKKFDFVKMLEAVQNYRITTLTMVPPIVVVRFPPQVSSIHLITVTRH